MKPFFASLSRPLKSLIKHLWTLFSKNKRGIVLAAILIFSGYLYNQKVGIRKAQFQFYAKKNAQNRRIIQRIKESSSQDALHPLLHNRHLQTILPTFLAKRFQKQKHWNLHFKRMYVKLQDGGVKALDVAIDGVQSSQKDVKEAVHVDHLELRPGASGKSAAPLIVVLPGLTSSIQQLYVIKMARQALDAGYQCVIANHRGAGTTKISTPQTYSAANTNDVQEALEYIQKCMFEEGIYAPIFGVGFSLGANILMKYIAERGYNVPLRAAVSVHNPYNFVLCSQNIEKELFGVYDRVLGASLKRKVRANRETLKVVEETTSIKLDDVLSDKVKTVRHFDYHYTSRLFNYPTVYEYYRDSSCDRLLLDVKIPTFLMDAKDDPITTSNAIPFEECEVNENLVLAVSEGGGHLGCISPNFDMLYHKHVTAYLDLFCKEELD